ncbi:MAG: sigma-54-dependent Fis family transcriptional regulator [Candidatus Omnitrophica bacterium]|nr:sigma-54-dependent Fis family transcriptional regulator [Candidatus Omnitrophota bacterium]
MAEVLVIDDDRQVGESLTRRFTSMGHRTMLALTLAEGLRLARQFAPDVVFLDVHMPDGNGLQALPSLREGSDPPEVIIFTGQGDPDGAEIAIKSGAWDYVEKGSSLNEIVLPFIRALQYREQRLAARSATEIKRAGIIGDSPPLRECLDMVAQSAQSNSNVLILGETGTGKELFARAIHANSRRASRNFVVVDCTVLPETLVESMLFGHEKGAFTGAESSREGLVGQADGGTLFLDEIGELPLPLQKSFLRVLQERRFRPIGSRNEVESDFRLVAATNRNLDQMVREGTLREDLLFRLRAFTLELPPLRARKGDIPELATFHTMRICNQFDIEPKEFSPEFLEALKNYAWPGNIRELVNTLERSIAAAGPEGVLFPQHLPVHVRVELARAGLSARGLAHRAELNFGVPPHTLPRWEEFREAALAQAEQQYLRALLAQNRGDIRLACARSGLSRSRLYALLKQHGFTRAETPPSPALQS